MFIVDWNIIIQIFFWSGTAMTIAARYFNIKKKWYCFIFWIIGGAVIIIQTVIASQWNIVAYQVVYMIFNIWGMVEWHRYSVEKRSDRR